MAGAILTHRRGENESRLHNSLALPLLFLAPTPRGGEFALPVSPPIGKISQLEPIDSNDLRALDRAWTVGTCGDYPVLGGVVVSIGVVASAGA